LKILIVEDEVISAMYLEMMLKRKNYNVLKPVGTGENAVKAARKHNPDVIIMDIRLAGEMDGIEAAREIRSFSSPFIIFMTGYQIDGLKEQLEFFSASVFLMKPVDFQQIHTEINNISGR
jgi:two-component system, response regulator PdtaR